jgi:N-acetyl sugar amidotransferase
MSEEHYRSCSRCIMDTTDPEIEFDGNGECNHCKDAAKLLKKIVFSGRDAEERLERLVAEIRRKGEGHDYDCIIGLSGGVDSSYLAYKTKELGLRPLAVHLDNGWNSEPAVGNIERIVKRLDIDLYTHVIDWEEFRDLQRAFFKASVIDIELLTDHAIAAVTYHVARKNKISYFISGYNAVTESVMPRTWFFGNKMDSLNIRSIFARYGEQKKLETFPLLSLYEYIMLKHVQKIKTVSLLNYLPYNKEAAMAVLQDKLGWVYYGGKHYESRFTQFYQAYILPEKFHVDKRKAHLSSLIYSGQITREQALTAMGEDLYLPDKLKEDREFLIKKLGFTEGEFDEYMKAPAHDHLEFPSYTKTEMALSKLKKKIKGQL